MNGKKPGKAPGKTPGKAPGKVEEKATPAKRQKTGGRKKGTPNKISRDIKEAILDAFEELGGVDYLVQLGRIEPTSFATLLGKVLPIQVTGAEGKDLLPPGFIVEIVDSAKKTKR